MPLYRDTKTGEVLMRGVDPDRKKNDYYKDPKFGDVRTKHIEYLEEERKTRTNQSLSNPGNSTAAAAVAFFIGPEDPILLQNDASIGIPGEVGCPNAQDREDLRIEGIILNDIQSLTHLGSPFLNRLVQLCLRAKIQHCNNAQCVENRERIRSLAPRCEWRGFREWSLQLLACQATLTTGRQFTRPFFHMSAAIASCHWLIIDAKFRGRPISDIMYCKDKSTARTDAFGAFEVIYWMLTIQASLGINIVIEGKWSVDFLPVAITEPEVTRAAEEARGLGICANRFWNLVVATERQHIDLPGIMHVATRHPRLRHTGHDACTPVLCHSTTLDSTRVGQLHKCPEESRSACTEQLFFDPRLLNNSIEAKGRTVWTCSEPFEVSQAGPYMAVSHVWSDGTGIGLKPAGQVNKCLFEYFASIGKTLECTGIWWDTISIPTDPEYRRIEINRMHENYNNAKFTVLHDGYLANFTWTDDGAPCLALVFSAWLTRGWTALELIMSKNVKVIFENPENGGLLVKDLEEDILAKDPGSCTRGHWIASNIIRRLRQPISNVSNLVAVLRPRSTSWPRDRMVIAGLLSGIPNIDYSWSLQKITKAIADKVVKINPGALHHGQPTITESGGWSWCPPSLYDMPSETIGDVFELGQVGDPTCYIDAKGFLTGYWHWRPLEREDSLGTSLWPNAEHRATRLKIEAAIRRWQYCMLLRDNNTGDGLALLAIPVKKDRDTIHVKFVGSVRELSAKAGSWDSRFTFNLFRVGAEGPEAKVAQFYNDAQEKRKRPGGKQSTQNYKWVCGKLWMGDQEESGQLLVARRRGEKRKVLEGLALEIRVLQDGEVTVVLSDKPVFKVDVTYGLGIGEDSTAAIRGLKPDSLWPPPTIPAMDRTHNPSPLDYTSRDIFRLETVSQNSLYAALNPKLFTPDDTFRYRGIWAGISKDHSPIFVLFHQPYATHLEAINLTGHASRSRGFTLFMVEDLNTIKKVSEDEDWRGRPIVGTAPATLLEDMPPPGKSSP
ncbi:hypothetical protein F5Y03DRAFT_352675 [Xylaria venustula]|nr:hypothetical protein F5Y03DRAFT_352675 [Xylaria venustula]